MPYHKRSITNIFTTVEPPTYLSLCSLSSVSVIPRRTIYRMALMYAISQGEFWDLLGSLYLFPDPYQADIAESLRNIAREFNPGLFEFTEPAKTEK